MNLTVLGVVFVIALFGCIALLTRFTQKKVVEEPLKEGRERGSLIAEFVDDLRRHRWIAIIIIAALVAVARTLRISSDLVNERVVLVAAIVAIFGARLFLRHRLGGGRARPPEQGR